MSDLFEEVSEEEVKQQQQQQPARAPLNSVGNMSAALLSMLQAQYNTTAISVTLIEQYGQDAIPAEVLEQYTNPLLAIATNVNAPWVANVISACHAVWESDNTTTALTQYLSSIGVPDEQLQTYKQQILATLPTIFTNEDSPENYKLYKGLTIYSVLYKYPTPELPFDFEDKEGEAPKRVMPPKQPTVKGVSGKIGQLAGKATAGAMSISKQFEEGKQSGLGDYAEDYRQLKEQQQRDAEKARLEEERQALQEERERIAEESRRAADQLRRQEQEMAERHYQQRIQQTNRSYNRYDPYAGTRDLSPQISTKAIIVIAHVIVALLCLLLLKTSGAFLCIGIAIATIGWLRQPMGKSRTLKIRSNDKINPWTQIVVGYFICILALLLFT